MLQPAIIGQDVLLDLIFSLDQLVFCRDVLVGELAELDATVLILVKFIEKLVYDLLSMLVINSLSRQEIVHFTFINFTIAVFVDLREFLLQQLLLGHVGIIRETSCESWTSFPLF